MLKYVFIFLFFVSNTFAQSLNESFQERIEQYHDIMELPSVVAGIAVDDSTVWIGAEGFADLENNVETTKDHLYRIASISKFITSVAIMQLVEKGLVDLDQDVRKYIPYFPKKRFTITARNLLNHTSGFRGYKNIDEFNSTTQYDSISLVVKYSMDDYLANKPGTEFYYSTMAYNVLAVIIEEVSGMTYAQYLQKHIFEPAGMTRTTLERQSEILKKRAHGYIRNEYEQLINAPLSDLSLKYPGGGLLSTVPDLLNFGKALLAGKLVSKQSIDTMIVKTVLSDNDTIPYGLGTRSAFDSLKGLEIGHGGGGTGFSSGLYIYPDKNIVVAHLTNLNDYHGYLVSKDLANIYLGKTMEDLKPRPATQLFQAYAADTTKDIFTMFEQLLKENRYEMSPGNLYAIGRKMVELNKPEEAIGVFTYGVSQFPKSAFFHLRLAETYAEMEDQKQTLYHINKALELEPENEEVIKIYNFYK